MESESVDPFQLFGLPRDAPLEDIRRRYRELALAYHPDRRGGDDVMRGRQFSAVVSAYEAILQARQADERNQVYGSCQECGRQRALVPRLDGTFVCVDCINRIPQTSLLPPPAWVVAKCTFSAVCLVASIVCFVLFVSSGSTGCGLLSMALGIVGLAVLATMGFFMQIMPGRDITKAAQASRNKRGKGRYRPRS